MSTSEIIKKFLEECEDGDYPNTFEGGMQNMLAALKPLLWTGTTAAIYAAENYPDVFNKMDASYMVDMWNSLYNGNIRKTWETVK